MNKDLKETLEGVKLPCLMCDNRDYGWYEVMRDNCGKTTAQIFDSLCDVHQDIFKEQVKNEMTDIEKKIE